MACFLSPIRPVCYIIPTTEIYFQSSLSIGFEVVHDQGPSMNGINLKIVCRCCGNNMFKDPDDDDGEGFVSSFGTHEDAMLSPPMACYYHKLVWFHTTWHQY